MNFSNTVAGISKLTDSSIRQLNSDLENYMLSETNTKEFLIYFFRNNIENSLFVKQILNFGEKALLDFQEHIFIQSTSYFKELVNIDGLSFSYDKNIFPLVIDVSISKIILCKIYVFEKKIEVLENFYFKDIRENIEKLRIEKEKLLDEYMKLQKYENNTLDLIKDDTNSTMLKSVDILVASMRKNKNKYKIELQNRCVDIEIRVHNIDLEIEEYLLIEASIKKSMLSIGFYQNKICDRIVRNLNYTTYKN